MSMNKIEAIEWAADFVERTKMFDAPLNKNGYPVDGWKGVTVSERADIIVKLADQVVESGDTPEGGYRVTKKDLQSVIDCIEKAKSLDRAVYNSSWIADGVSYLEELIKNV